MRFQLSSIAALQLTSVVLAAAPTQLKLSITHWRRPEFTHEEFVEQFVDVYVPKLSQILQKYDVTEVASFVTTKEQSEEAKNIAPESPPGYEYADWDLTMEYIIPSLDHIKRAMQDPEYAEMRERTNKYIIPGKRRIALGDYESRAVAKGTERELK